MLLLKRYLIEVIESGSEWRYRGAADNGVGHRTHHVFGRRWSHRRGGRRPLIESREICIDRKALSELIRIQRWRATERRKRIA